MDKNYGLGLPIDISSHGPGVDHLIIGMHILMIVLFLGWLVFFIYTLIRFHHKNNPKAEYHGKHFKLPTVVEVVVALLEFALLVGLSMPIWFKLREIPRKPDALKVRIVAQQFAWNFHYPGADGKFGKTSPKLMDSANPVGLDKTDAAAKDDIVTINQLCIPVNKPISVELTSKDVIHSFFIPVMRVKQDAIPGQKVKMGFEAIKEGEFEIACAQLCGLGHYRMKGFFNVYSEAKFNEWLSQQVTS